MEAQVPAFVPILLLAGAAVLVYSFVTIDRLLKAQYEFHRDAWTADGQPRGFFWRAPECTWFESGLALHRLSLTWLFNTPAWVGDSARYRVLLKRLRLSVLLSNVLIVAAIVAIIGSLG
jgi:hypothetical protein